MSVKPLADSRGPPPSAYGSPFATSPPALEVTSRFSPSPRAPCGAFPTTGRSHRAGPGIRYLCTARPTVRSGPPSSQIGPFQFGPLGFVHEACSPCAEVGYERHPAVASRARPEELRFWRRAACLDCPTWPESSGRRDRRASEYDYTTSSSTIVKPRSLRFPLDEPARRFTRHLLIDKWPSHGDDDKPTSTPIRE